MVIGPLTFLVIIVALLVLSLLLLAILWYYPSIFFVPMNAWLARDATPVKDRPYFEQTTLSVVYPDYQYAEQNYHIIRDEGWALWDHLARRHQNYLDHYNVDLATASTDQWTTLPLRVFGRDYPDYQRLCPFTTNLLRRCPNIRSCLFSFMAPGKVINPHYGPYHGLLRCQIPLQIPDNGASFLTVDGVDHYWREGQSLLFDETFLHSASNLTEHWRLVLLLDLPRPYQSSIRQLVADAITTSMGWLSTGVD